MVPRAGQTSGWPGALRGRRRMIADAATHVAVPRVHNLCGYVLKPTGLRISLRM